MYSELSMRDFFKYTEYYDVIEDEPWVCFEFLYRKCTEYYESVLVKPIETHYTACEMKIILENSQLKCGP